MYATISYTVHLSVCLTIGLIFWFYKGEGSSRGSTYRTFLRILAIIAMISAAMDAVLLYLHASGIDDSFMYGFISYYFNIIITGLYFRPFLLNLRTNAKLVQWQDGLAFGFVTLGLVHPILYYQFQLSHHSVYSPSIASYEEFLKTSGCEVLTLIVYVVGAAYLLLSLYNTIRHLRIILLWDRHGKGKHVFTLAFKIFFFLFFAFMLMIVDTVVFEFFDFPYYADLPVWSVYSLVATILVLNFKQEYVRLEHEAIRLQIELVGAKMFYRKSALKLNDDENIHRKEEAVVLRALSDWSGRDDKPYLDEKLTISALSEAVGIPAIIIIRYLNSSYGLSFDEYIGYLSVKSHERSEKHIIA